VDNSSFLGKGIRWRRCGRWFTINETKCGQSERSLIYRWGGGQAGAMDKFKSGKLEMCIIFASIFASKFLFYCWYGRYNNFKIIQHSCKWKGELCNSQLVDKIDEHEDLISWSWCWSNFRNLAISKKAEAYKISSVNIWLPSKNKLNHPNHNFIASPTTQI